MTNTNDNTRYHNLAAAAAAQGIADAIAPDAELIAERDAFLASISREDD